MREVAQVTRTAYAEEVAAARFPDLEVEGRARAMTKTNSGDAVTVITHRA